MNHRISKRLIPWATTSAILIATSAAPAQVSLGLERTLFVAPGNNTVQACNDLIAVLGSIHGATQARKYSVRLGPGIFDCGNQTVVVPQNVSLIGEGARTTTLRGAVDSVAFGVVHLLGNSEIRQLRVVNNVEDPTQYGAVAISAWNLDSTSNIFLEHVRAEVPRADGKALYAAGAVVEVRSSTFTAVADLQTGSVVFFLFSHLLSGVVKHGGTANCQLTLNDTGTLLDAGCT